MQLEGLGSAVMPNDIWCIFGLKMLYLARPSMQLGDLGTAVSCPSFNAARESWEVLYY